MQFSESGNSLSPSNVIKQTTAALVGPSYREHDDGVQRKKVSDEFANVLEKWTCGLLSIELSANEHAAVFDAFDEFILTKPAPDHFIWGSVHPNILDDIVSMYWKRSLDQLKNRQRASVLPAADDYRPEKDIIPAEELPVTSSLRALSIALVVFEHALASNGGSRCAAGDGLAHFLFVFFWLSETLNQFPQPTGGSVRNVLHRTLSLAQKARRNLPLEVLTTHTLRDVIRVAGPVVCADADATDGGHSRRMLLVAPALCGVLAVVKASMDVDTSRIIDILPELLEQLRNNVDVTQQDLRIVALDTLGVLHNRLSHAVFIPHAPRLVAVLPSALLWHDVASSTRAIPLLAAFTPYILSNVAPPPLAEPAPREWDAVISALFTTMQHHVKASLLDHSSSIMTSFNDTPNEHISAAAVVLSVIPSLAQHRLIARVDEYICFANKLLPRAAALLYKDSISSDVVVLVANAICDALAHAWCRAPAFCSSIFASVVAAVLEVRYASDSVKTVVGDACQDIIVRLSVVDITTVRSLIHNTRHVAEKYSSLHAVVNFLDMFASTGFPVLPKGRTPAGPLINKFF